MKRWLSGAQLASLVFLLPAFSFAQPALISTDADFALIFDHESQTTLFSKNAETPMVPASMTKIMTVQVAFERLATGELQLTDKIEVSENAWRKGGASSGGSTMFLEPKDTPTVEELLRGIMILSGNDACIALAEGISGSEEAFVEEMNYTAERLGLESATFSNVTGLYDEDHLISSVDLARLASRQLNQFPDLYALYSEPSYEWRGIKQPNRNPLLGSIDGADGVKTGHLSVSGYGLVGSAVREGVRRTIVINGLDTIADRRREAQRLMNLAFTAFEERTASSGEVVGTLDVYMGTSNSVEVALGEPISLLLHKRAANSMKTEIVQSEPLIAPVRDGQEVARLVVHVDGEPVADVPLLAKSSIDGLGFFGRVIAGLANMLGE